jgi:hypothetical protein
MPKHRRFDQMDRPLVEEPTHVAPGILASVAMMGPKARARDLTIDVEVPDEPPPVHASAAEAPGITW